MGLFLKVGAIFIQSIFGISNNDNLLTIIMFILLVLVLIYTVSGGMISVIVTDYIQYVILSIGFMFCVFYSIKTLGWNNLFESLEFIVLQNNENYNIDKIYNPIHNAQYSFSILFLKAIMRK